MYFFVLEMYFDSPPSSSKSHSGNIGGLEKTNMLFFGCELTRKGRSLKTQMMISSNKCEVVKSSERIWYDNGFFSDQRADFNLSKNIFPENTLVYVNQGTISTVKNDLAIYINCLILGQVIPAQSSPKGIESYKCKQKKTKLIVPLHDLSTGNFLV